MVDAADKPTYDRHFYWQGASGFAQSVLYFTYTHGPAEICLVRLSDNPVETEQLLFTKPSECLTSFAFWLGADALVLES